MTGPWRTAPARGRAPRRRPGAAALFDSPTPELIARIVARNARRARRAAAALRRIARTGEQRQACRALVATLSRLREPERTEFYFGPDLRAWLAAFEEAAALSRPDATDAALFERVARGPHLKELLPEHRLDRGFRRRVRAHGKRLLDRAFRRLPPLLMFLTPPGRRFGPFAVDVLPGGEEARIAGEVHLRFPLPGTLHLEDGATLDLVGGGVRIHQRGEPATWRPRRFIVRSAIVLARRVVSTPRGLRPGPHVRGLARRLGEALDLILEAWEEAYREVVVHTREVVPLVERGTVSYSLAERPGASYINVRGKSTVDLADDLLHETAHHRLHSVEELSPLHRRDDDALYHSPWRRSMRPLHGLLHAAYTFTFRAELFRRLLATRHRLPRAWIRREFSREVKMLREAQAHLSDAGDRGLLTPAGSRLRRALAAHLARMARARP